MRTHVDESFFVFATDIVQGGFQHTVAVHWAGRRFAPSEGVVALSDFLAPRVEITEVWFVYPEDLESTYRELQSLENFKSRTMLYSDINFRFFAIDGLGAWNEVSGPTSEQSGPRLDVEMGLISGVIDDGLRQIFRDTHALVTASAGYHFARALRRHSNRFMMTSLAVSRAQHAYFVAAALLRNTTVGEDARLFADTAGILPALYALSDLVRRLTHPDAEIHVDSFRGYEGYASSLKVRDDRDWVFISSSTSGSLVAELEKELRIRMDRVVTFFYLSLTPPDAGAGAVLCDLTNRDVLVVQSVREARVSPFPTYSLRDGCLLCEEGSRPIELAGDGFFPAADTLQLRMPVLRDRPLKGVRRKADQSPFAFDGDGYFYDFFGLEAIRPARAMPSGPSSHDVSTTIAHLLNGHFRNDAVVDRLDKRLEELLVNMPAVGGIASLLDSDSRSLAKFVAERKLPASSESADGQLRSKISGIGEMRGIDAFRHLPLESTLVVCAGVVASGRALLTLNRELRSIPESVRTVYLVGVVHPESASAWQVFENTVARRSSSGTNGLTYGWLLPREPRLPGAEDIWAREVRTLGAVEGFLSRSVDTSQIRRQISRRIQEINNLPHDRLFVSSTFGLPNERPMTPVNKKFSLWPFEWSEHERSVSSGKAPSQAEMLATVAHFMYESRRFSSTIDFNDPTVLRHGYALNPAVFDRFNEPQIQASILRSAEPGELYYRSDKNASRAMADVVAHVLKNAAFEGGDAAYEFLLSLAHGYVATNGSGMRIADGSLQPVLAVGISHSDQLSPLVQGLIRYLRADLADH